SPDTLHLHLRRALASRIVVEQAKGFLRERLAISVDEAFTLLRRYAHTHHGHMTVVARRLLTEPDTRPAILAAMRQLTTVPQ
ncbi:MAG TPA: ANTAR domain-containing protein, partial [Mycobacterium sp.]